MSDGGKEAVAADDAVVAAAEVRRLEERVRELERLPGRKDSSHYPRARAGKKTALLSRSSLADGSL